MALVLTIALSSASVHAQSRTVCFGVGIAENRTNCPGRGHPTAGSRFTCDGSAVGLRVQLWDADSASADDDLIGTYRIAFAGTNCVTFNWTDTADAPDVYIRILPSVRGSSSGTIATVRRNNGTAASPSWGNYPWAWTRSWGQVNNCAAGATCTILPGQTIVPSADPATDVSEAYMVLQSAGRALEVFNSAISDTNELILQVDELTQWPTNERCQFACQTGLNLVRIPLGQMAREADRTAHEVGHILQAREFGNDFGGNCTSGWNMDVRTNDNCATVEGFAAYVSGATWYNPASTGGQPRYAGFDLENPTPTNNSSCFNNHDIPGQVAKAYWDLDDAANELSVGVAAGVQDTQNLSTTTILNLWSNLPNGSQNGGNDEPEAEGMNVMDYWYEALDSAAPTAWDTLIFQNCLDDQTI